MAPGHLDAQISRQHAPGGKHGGEARHDHPGQPKLARHRCRVQAGGAAEGEQRELAGINAAPHRDEAHTFSHRGVDDPVNAIGRRRAVDAQRAGDAIDGSLGGRAVEPAPAAEKVVRVDEAEHHVGVGDGGRGATEAVAGGSGVGAGALRSNVQDAARIDARDRAAAGADADDVEAVQRHTMAAHGSIHGQARAAADDERNVGRGASHVERDEVADLDELAGVTAAGDAARGS